MLRRTLTLAAALVALAVPASALGMWDGKGEPNDPGYDAAEHDPITKCINDEQWYLFSFIPKCTPLAKDPEGSSGMFVDRAWREFTAGRPDVTIAYVEAGPNWHQEVAQRDIAPRTYLNRGELPKPAGSSSYDKNGDGQVNVEDYASDPRVKKPYVNGALTPEDLIVAFSNHRDDDGNGYVDDISGWNFSRGNNDPATGDSAYGHSNSQLRRAAAEANNGYGQVGLCPRCTLLPIKGGDEALDRTDRIAQTIYFAVDSGASVVVLLDAELGYSSLTKRALDYAWKKGVVVVGASNDFDSADHQNGMFWPRVWPGNGLQSDASGPVQGGTKLDHVAHSFRERSNETSFGPHSLFSAPDNGGSTSESTPTNAGVAALVAAEGRDAADKHQIGGRLDAGEVKQVVRSTASNIDDPDLGWPGKPGATFNQQYGYGRPNVLKAMRAVAANRIPPVPDIHGPRWYQLYDPTRSRSVPIRAAIDAHRAHTFTYRVEYGIGPDPTEAEFHTIGTGRCQCGHVGGELGRLDLSSIPKSVWQKPLRYTNDLSSTEQHTVTIRVQATDERGNMGEDRRAIAVFHDPSLRRGYPRYLGQGKEPQPELADLNGDGRLEMIFGDADGRVHALNRRGRELKGFPVHTRKLRLGLTRTPAGRAHAVPVAHEPIIGPAAVGDLNGDGSQEIVVVSETGRLYAFTRRGKRVRGFPKALGAGVRGYPVPPPARAYTRPPSMGAFAAPVLVRLPGSRTKLDVLQAAWDGRLYAFDGRGRTLPGWPVDAQVPAADRPKPPFADVHDYKLVATPTLADLNGDGKPEVVVKSQEFEYSADPSGLGFGSRFYVLAYWGDGNKHPGGALVPGWPARLDGTLGYYGSAQDFITEGGDSASAADTNGDGKDEVVQSTVFGVPQKIQPDGSAQPLAPQPNPAAVLFGSQPGPQQDRVPTSDNAAAPVTFTESGTFADFGGGLSYLSAGEDLASVAALVHNGIAQRITNFMRVYDAGSGATRQGFPAPMMGLPFVTAPAVADISGDGKPDVVNAEDTSNVAGFREGGQPVAGWPKFTGGWSLETPAVGDLDGDGRSEVVSTTREGYLFVWDTPGRADASQAWAWHQDDWHTGRFGTDTRPPARPQKLRRRGRRLCWRAPGDDWSAGRARAYGLRVFRSARRARRLKGGKRVKGVPAPARAGTRQCAKLPRRARFVALRAYDDAGLVSLPARSRHRR